ncbi:MAG: hypothetical protein A2W19_08425 [Spirochaetes bacterium RBG_16_49_21]|nr:MAG: hypothetical protein A2W19_08425 [Spirochaetes bacterium RBG_16_49_21]
MKLHIYTVKVAALGITASLLLAGCALSAAQKEILCLNTLGSPIPEFCEVKPNVLWRGSKPDRNTAAWLINKGVSTIVNLELLHDDMDTITQETITGTGTYKIDYFRVKTWEPLYAVTKSNADEDVIHFLAVVSRAKQPVYVHCRAGENRTGVMVAAYKIILNGQTSKAEMAKILDEMQSYKGAWSESTTKYIKGLFLRRDEIIKKVRAFKVEDPIQIICNKGKCVSNPRQFRDVLY